MRQKILKWLGLGNVEERVIALEKDMRIIHKAVETHKKLRNLGTKVSTEEDLKKGRVSLLSTEEIVDISHYNKVIDLIIQYYLIEGSIDVVGLRKELEALKIVKKVPKH